MTARRLRAIVLAEQVDGYLVAMADPTNLLDEDELERQLGRPVHTEITRERDLLLALDRVYLRRGEIEGLAAELGQEIIDSTPDEGARGEQDASDALVSRLINSLLEEAIQAGASDIHIEPDEDVLRIRQRVDGLLRELPAARNGSPSARPAPPQNPASNPRRRAPPRRQDGRFRVNVRGRTLDVRPVTMPTAVRRDVVLTARPVPGTARLESLMPELMLACIRRVFIGCTACCSSLADWQRRARRHAALNELNCAGPQDHRSGSPGTFPPRFAWCRSDRRSGLLSACCARASPGPDVIPVGRNARAVEISPRRHHGPRPSTLVNGVCRARPCACSTGVPGFLIANALRAVVASA